MTILHVSDVHAGHGPGLAMLERAAAWSEELRPDLIALTGDLVTRARGVKRLQKAAAALAATAGWGRSRCSGTTITATRPIRSRTARASTSSRGSSSSPPSAAASSCGVARCRSSVSMPAASRGAGTSTSDAAQPGRRPPRPALPLPDGARPHPARRVPARPGRAPACRADLHADALGPRRPRPSARPLPRRAVPARGNADAHLAGARNHVPAPARCSPGPRRRCWSCGQADPALRERSTMVANR